MHLGHYVGALANWLKLQSKYECQFLIADYQALTDNFDDPKLVRRSVTEVALDWLAVGLDPERASYVVQSAIPEHAELFTLLSFITPLGMLERNPTLKAELERLPTNKRNVGFYSYPVSQIADILLPRAHLVPTGEDQTPHIEMTREIARKFNRIFAPIFPEPRSLVGGTGRLMGTDGRGKMSKSQGNAILLSDDADTVARKVRSMYTDPNRLRATDPGTVEGNPVFQYHDAFNPDKQQVEGFKERYRAGTIGDVEVKQVLTEALNQFLNPIRERRAQYAADMSQVEQALREGTERARETAQATMAEVRKAMGIAPAG